MAWKLVPDPCYFQRIHCKKDSEVSILTWTDFERFAITYLIEIACFKNFIFQWKLCLILCKHKRAWNCFQATVFVELFDEIFCFLIWHKLANFHQPTVFTSQVIQWNIFLVLCLGIWWCHDSWKCRILKFGFLEDEKSFWSETKNIFPSLTSAPVWIKKQTSKNVADITFDNHLINGWLYFAC